MLDYLYTNFRFKRRNPARKRKAAEAEVEAEAEAKTEVEAEAVAVGPTHGLNVDKRARLRNMKVTYGALVCLLSCPTVLSRRVSCPV